MNDWIKWVLWIDIEGYSYKYRQNPTQAEWLLHNLVRDLYRFGNEIFPERLFIHQVGDGFLLKGDFCDTSLERALSIAIPLLRKTLLGGACLKIALGVGELYGVQGLYPAEVREKAELGHLRIGSGIMTLHTVMGEGLIDSYHYSGLGSGPLLIVRGDLENALPDNIIYMKYEKHIEVDWIHSPIEFADVIVSKFGISATPTQLSDRLTTYIAEFDNLPDAWKKSASLLIQGYPQSSV